MNGFFKRSPQQERIVAERPDAAADRRIALMLYLLMAAIRVVYSLYHPPCFAFSMSDSENYYLSGLYFAGTGSICYPVPIKTAWIMPGISLLIGGLSLLFPEGAVLFWAIRVTWILIGSLAAAFLYRSIRLFRLPRWIAVLSALCYMLPWYIQIDCYVQTEGPAFAFFAAALYYGLRLGTEDALPSDRFKFGLALVCGILFRASTILLSPFMAVWWILCRKHSFRHFLRSVSVAALPLLMLLLPWTVRNAVVFRGWIPLTYASGDPVYEGTFVGEGIPTEEELRELNDGYDAEEEVRKAHPSLFDEQGKPIDENVEQYVSHLVLAALGRHRLKQWYRLNPSAFLKSYLYSKPKQLLNDVWYWDPVPGISLRAAVELRKGNLLLCAAAGLLSLFLKRNRKAVWFLGISYLVNLYLVAASLPLDRYGQAIMPYRLILGAFGLSLITDFLLRLKASISPDMKQPRP